MRAAVVAVCVWPALAAAQPQPTAPQPQEVIPQPQALAPQPCFEESNAFSARIGIAHLRRVGSTEDRGAGSVAEIEYRRHVSARASLSAVLAYSRVEYHAYSGTPVELGVTLVGARLAGWLAPRVALGADLGFSLFRRRAPEAGYSRSDAGQFVGVFMDMVAADLGGVRINVGGRMSLATTFLVSGLVGVDW